MYVVELLKGIHRLRTYVLGGCLTGVAILPAVLQATSSGGGGPPFFDLVRHNGLFAGLAAMALIQPFFLPLGTGLLAGEAVAAESAGGTLRYLLVRPVGRVRLVVSKYLAVMTQLASAVVWVTLVGLLAGAIAFGFGPLPTLSGSTLAVGSALIRTVAAAVYIVAGVAGLAAVGVFLSTLTDSGVGAAAATVSLAIASQILDSLSSLRAIHPYLLTHQWLAYADLFRAPVAWGGIEQGLVLAAVYTAVFLGAALAFFSRKDVVS